MAVFPRKTVDANKRGAQRECRARKIRVKHLPYFYNVLLDMRCNERCIMCVPDGRHPHEILPFEDFVAFFNDIQPYAEHLALMGGEPLLYPWIEQVLDLLAKHPVTVTINSNMTLLTDTLAERLCNLHALEMRCSVDAATRDTYRKIRGLDMFERVTAAMTHLSRMARDRPRIRLIPIYVVMRENLAEVVPFVHWAKTFRPERVEFHPVRHVQDWVVDNNTGWTFNGAEQSCEFLKDEYNQVMREAVDACRREGLSYEISFL